MPKKLQRPPSRPKKTPAPRQRAKRTAATKLEFSAAGKIAVLAVGSSIRGDDAAGLLAAGHLKDFARRSRGRVKIFLGETAPENLTGEIKRYQPAHLVVIDAMDTQAPPGELHTLEFHEQEFSSLGPTSTHNLPLGVLLKYLQAFLSCRITVIGIQPKSLGFNQPVTKNVDRAARLVADLFQQAFAAAT